MALERTDKNRFHFLMVFISCLLDGCYTIHVSLRSPRYVMVNGTASLHCDFDVSDSQIHKVEWLRGENKIYQYIKGRNPPYKNFSIAGADIDWKNSDDRKLSLKNLQFEGSGVYTCEVTTDNPIYTKPSEEEYLTVMQSQSNDPHISFNQANYSVGDVLDANCTSSPATPVPELTWLVNGKKAEEKLIRSYPESMKSSSMMQLTKVIDLKEAPQLTLTCLSTIPGFLGHNVLNNEYADYRADTITVDVSVPPTEAAQIAGVRRLQCQRKVVWFIIANAVWMLPPFR